MRDAKITQIYEGTNEIQRPWSPNAQIVTARLQPRCERRLSQSLIRARDMTRLPDFFIVGHPKSGTTALYEMLRRHPQIYMPDGKEPGSSRRSSTNAPLRGRKGRRRRSPSTGLCSPAARPGASTSARRARCTCGRAPPRGRHRRGPARGAHCGDPAGARGLPALAASPVRADLRRDRGRPGQGALVRGRAPAGQAHPAPLPPARGAPVLRASCATSSTFAATTRVFAPEQVLVLIYDDFRRHNEATVRTRAALPRRGRRAAACGDRANPTVARRSTHLQQLFQARCRAGGARRCWPSRRRSRRSPPGACAERSMPATQRQLYSPQPRPPDAELMLELRRRFKPEVEALSEYLDRDLVKLWGYDRSADRRPRRVGQGAGLLHRRPSQVRHDRAVRDAQAPSADLHARAQGAAVLRERDARRRCRRSRTCPRRWRSTPRCSRGARPDQLIGEASPSYLRSHTAAARIAEVQPDARIIAILREPASFLRSVHLQFVQSAHRDRVRPAQGARARGRQAPGQAPPAPLARGRRRCSTPSTCATSSSCAATTTVFATRTGAGADLRRLSRRQRGDRAHGAALPRRGRHRAGRGDRGQHDGARCAPGGSRTDARGDPVGRGPVSRGVKAAVKALTPEAGCAQARCGRRGAPVVYGAPPPRTRS